MKYTILIVLLLPVLALADFYTNSNSATVDVTQVTGDVDSFGWYWMDGDTQLISLYMTNNAGWMDLSGQNYSFRMARNTETGQATYVTVTNITISSSNLSWTVARTNMPDPNTYQAEVLAWQGADTNANRIMAQGTITIKISLH